MQQIVTRKFKVSRSELLKSALYTRTFRAVWWSVALLVMMGISASIAFDWRWGLVTVMILLVLAPAVLALAYLNYALSPRCFPEIYQHTVSFREGSFTVDAEVPPLPPKEDEQDTKDEVREVKNISFTAGYDEVSKLRVTLTSLVIYLKGKHPGIVHIPYEMLSDAKEQGEWIIKKCRRQ